MDVGANLEFARSERVSLEDSLRQAYDAGYKFVEPCPFRENDFL